MSYQWFLTESWHVALPLIAMQVIILSLYWGAEVIVKVYSGFSWLCKVQSKLLNKYEIAQNGQKSIVESNLSN